ncbi:glutathione S-transferase [Pseudoruegeria sp. SHC-113]|uniref:glutathione S-transferase n=1 Tax=Pseudoruegeria sp. SHC-113 TaxID=2855439 RepID=UPI0021BAB52C|nr:glutathione S-transferase [Pseudoruegeria sp. SHC-113]MCT8158743.1 glutathione S-transferase [Pseudoruegeria sp. SHC-113]
MTNLPILYSFRRCPYAMRARLALQSAQLKVELREILLRDKAPAFLAASPKGTVPVLVTKGEVIEESLDIMLYALRQNDPEGWLHRENEALALIAECDGPFKQALDRYKYASRIPDSDPEAERQKAALFLRKLDDMLRHSPWLLADRPTLADMATLTFLRQFAMVDRLWFDAQPWPHLHRWLDSFLASDRLAAIMRKYSTWQADDPLTIFP